jgi:hypothetical protein
MTTGFVKNFLQVSERNKKMSLETLIAARDAEGVAAALEKAEMDVRTTLNDVKVNCLLILTNDML